VGTACGGSSASCPNKQVFVCEAPITSQKRLTKPFLAHDVVVLKQTGNVVAARTSGGRVMSTIENDNAGSESWDPALWSIGTVLGIAIVYLACLT
jgi:hypothetical protein